MFLTIESWLAFHIGSVLSHLPDMSSQAKECEKLLRLVYSLLQCYVWKGGKDWTPYAIMHPRSLGPNVV